MNLAHFNFHLLQYGFPQHSHTFANLTVSQNPQTRRLWQIRRSAFHGRYSWMIFNPFPFHSEIREIHTVSWYKQEVHWTSYSGRGMRKKNIALKELSKLDRRPMLHTASLDILYRSWHISHAYHKYTIYETGSMSVCRPNMASLTSRLDLISNHPTHSLSTRRTGTTASSRSAWRRPRWRSPPASAPRSDPSTSPPPSQRSVSWFCLSH